jgi:acyl-CoA synthetase (AMP-forming)/AMP-acid ligase II
MHYCLLSRICGNVDKPAPAILIEAGHHGPTETLTRGRLYALALATGEFFRELGLEPGDRVASLLPTGRPLLQCIFGAWAAGAVVTVLAPTIEGGRSSLSLDRLGEMLRTVRPKVVVASGDEAALIGPIVAGLGADLLVPADLPAPGNDLRLGREHVIGSEDPAFIQFTSGSTGAPKAVVIEHGQLVKNIVTTAQWTGFSGDDSFASWLPLHHDFGFVVGLMMPLYFGAGLALLPTESFTKNPISWLKLLHDCRATFSGAPPSGLAILTKRAFYNRAKSIDLRHIRRIFVGAEPVSYVEGADFEDLYANFGLKKGVISPAYGMAEATLTVSVRQEFSQRKTAHISGPQFYKEGRVVLCDSKSEGAVTLFSNGPPIPGVQVRILDEADHQQREGVQGRIVISSTMVTRRYLGLDENPQPGGWLETGDLGFLLEGEVYVTGRSKDVIIRNGVNMPAHMIEQAALERFSDIALRAVAFAVPDERSLRDEVIVGVELRRWPPDEALPRAIRASIQSDLNFQVDRVVPLQKGSIPRTTSGKIQRSQARDLFRSGELALARDEEVA